MSGAEQGSSANDHDAQTASRGGLVLWMAAAFAIGIALALADLTSREKGPLLGYVMAGFWLAFLGGDRTIRRGIACAAAFPLVGIIAAGHADRSTSLAVLAITVFGAFTGKRARVGLMGTGEADQMQRWIRGGLRAPVPTHVLLATALSAIALLGAKPVFATLRWDNENVGLLTVRWWQALSFFAWILLTPKIVGLRRRLRRVLRLSDDDPFSTGEVVLHLGVVVVIVMLHAAFVVAAAIALDDVPGRSGFLGRVLLTARAYAPLDFLTYTAIHALTYLADRDRQANEARRREALMRASATSARLAALRAQLNPHFLYNTHSNAGPVAHLV